VVVGDAERRVVIGQDLEDGRVVPALVAELDGVPTPLRQQAKEARQPLGWAGFVQPRSGLALKHGVTCLNTPGLIDAGYRDELKVILVNTDPATDYQVRRGDRIAQLVLQRVESAAFVEVDDLGDSSRGTGGFGSTGV